MIDAKQLSRIIKHYAQNENSIMLKYYPNDINNIALDLHKLFIEEQVRSLEQIKSHKLIGDQILALNKLISQLKDQLK